MKKEPNTHVSLEGGGLMESHPDLNYHTTANTDTYFPNCTVGMKVEMGLDFSFNFSFNWTNWAIAWMQRLQWRFLCECFLTGRVTLQPVQPLLQPLTFDGVAATGDTAKQEWESSWLHFLMTFLPLNPAT